MLNREACQRRVYRLATLLTGTPTSATRVVAAVLDAQPDPAKLDSSHLDRLTVLRSREVTPGAIASAGAPRAVADAIAALEPQQREAWVFCRIFSMSPREASRSMDCSVTAVQRHLDSADESMRTRLESAADSAVENMRRYTLSLDVPGFYRRHQRIKARQRTMLLVLLAAVTVLAAVALMLWITQTSLL